MFSSSASQVSSAANFIEDVFQTWLYTGNGSTQTITNGVDLAGKGGLVWIKARNDTTDHYLHDSARSWGTGGELSTNNTAPAGNAGYFNVSSTGFSLPSSVFNDSGTTHASWTFRKQPKFFDVVTWTGDGQTFRTVNHNLGSMPGFIICKCTSTTSDWSVLAKMSSGSSDFIPLNLNTTASSRYGGGITAAVSSTLFYTADLGFDGSSDSQLRYNQNGQTYVAYLFASNAGGFGPTGSDNVISCGTFTTNGSAVATVTLGYEPQWIIVRNEQITGNNWFIWDTQRGWTADGTTGDFYLIPNISDAEGGGGDYGGPSATGFTIRNLQASNQFVYMAIRKNMKS